MWKSFKTCPLSALQDAVRSVGTAASAHLELAGHLTANVPRRCKDEVPKMPL